MRSLLVSISLLFPAGIASAANLNPNKLTKVQSPRIFLLESAYSQDEITAKNKEYIRHTIAPGPYVGAYEDTAGTYYLGGDDCMQFVVHRTETGTDLEKAKFNYDCGFYLPNDTSKNARLFYVTGTLGLGNPQAPQLTTHDTLNNAQTFTNSGVPSGAAYAGSAIGGMLVNAIIRSGQGKFRFIEPSGSEQTFDRAGLTEMRYEQIIQADTRPEM